MGQENAETEVLKLLAQAMWKIVRTSPQNLAIFLLFLAPLFRSAQSAKLPGCLVSCSHRWSEHTDYDQNRSWRLLNWLLSWSLCAGPTADKHVWRTPGNREKNWRRVRLTFFGVTAILFGVTDFWSGLLPYFSMCEPLLNPLNKVALSVLIKLLLSQLVSNRGPGAWQALKLLMLVPANWLQVNNRHHRSDQKQKLEGGFHQKKIKTVSGETLSCSSLSANWHSIIASRNSRAMDVCHFLGLGFRATLGYAENMTEVGTWWFSASFVSETDFTIRSVQGQCDSKQDSQR